MTGLRGPAVVACIPLASLLALTRCSSNEPPLAPQESIAPVVAVVAPEGGADGAPAAGGQIRVARAGSPACDDSGVDAAAEATAPAPPIEAGAVEAGVVEAATPDESGTVSAGDDGGDGDPSPFAACTVDADCIAVARLGCCDNGWLVAINRAQQAAYEASFTCQTVRPVCAMYRVIDTRVAECDNGTRQCTMIAIDKIACGGFIRNAHACPDGYACDYEGHVADIPGQCVSTD
jgi:hypothetical protein